MSFRDVQKRNTIIRDQASELIILSYFQIYLITFMTQGSLWCGEWKSKKRAFFSQKKNN
jgi:hypothetical protein